MLTTTPAHVSIATDLSFYKGAGYGAFCQSRPSIGWRGARECRIDRLATIGWIGHWSYAIFRYFLQTSGEPGPRLRHSRDTLGAQGGAAAERSRTFAPNWKFFGKDAGRLPVYAPIRRS
jgi:hypothetical protein